MGMRHDEESDRVDEDGRVPFDHLRTLNLLP